MIQLDPREYPEALQPVLGRVKRDRRMALRRAWNVLAPCLVACALFAVVAALAALAFTAADTLAGRPIHYEEPIAP